MGGGDASFVTLEGKALSEALAARGHSVTQPSGYRADLGALAFRMQVAAARDM